MSRTGSFCRWRTDLIIVCNENTYSFFLYRISIRLKITELDIILLDTIFYC